MKKAIAVCCAVVFSLVLGSTVFAMGPKGGTDKDCDMQMMEQCYGTGSCACCQDMKCAKGKKAKKNMKQCTPEQMVEKRAEALSKKLKLNDDQKAKLTALFKENAETMKAKMEAMRAEHKAAREATDLKIKAILTPEQVKQFDEMRTKQEERMMKRQEKKGHMQGNKPGDMPPPPTEQPK